jgi:hypothetical protein
METLLRGWFFGCKEGAFTAGMAPYPPLGGAKAGIGIRVSGCESVVFYGGGGQPAGLAAAPGPSAPKGRRGQNLSLRSEGF